MFPFFPRKKGATSNTSAALKPSKTAPMPHRNSAHTEEGHQEEADPDNKEHPLADYASVTLLSSSSPRSVPPLASRMSIHEKSPGGHTDVSPPRHVDRAKATPGNVHHEIVMDYGDVYSGEVALHPHRNVLVPHGHGTLQSARGKHCYVGGFVYQQREGWGKLVTANYAMWSLWKDNRPNLTASVRVDYPGGAKYNGYVEQLLSPVPSTPEPVSRFTQYILSVSFIKTGWGEMVYPDGRRYFGQWQNDFPTNFGCQITAEGDRYVGMWKRGLHHGTGVLYTRNGLVYDGLWVDGKYRCTGGEVTFPGHVKLCGEWEDHLHFKTATVTLPDRRSMVKKYTLTSLFNPLLSGAGSEITRKKALASAAPLRAALASADSPQAVETAFMEHLKVNEVFCNSLKIVRRCFYFCYGTCGSSQLRGSGQRQNKLGWCYLRRSFGGCIHHAHGDPITDGMVNDALGDVLSFVSSAYQWIMSLVGSAREVVLNLDAGSLVSKRIVDALLALIYPCFSNLYKQACSKEQLRLDAALKRLGNISMDDVGVCFARSVADDQMGLFVPYATSMNTLRRLTTASTFTGLLDVLVRWTIDIDDETRMNQIRLHTDDEMVQLLEALEKRRLALRDSDTHPAAAAPTTTKGFERDDSHSIAAAQCIVGGSLDDLFPIHQYVLLRSGVPDLVAHARLIGDLADVEWLLDSTSRESFCVTNLLACVAVVSEMHPAIRDASRVILPSSSIFRRVEDAWDDITSDPTTAPFAFNASIYVASLLDWAAECTLPTVDGQQQQEEGCDTYITLPNPPLLSGGGGPSPKQTVFDPSDGAVEPSSAWWDKAYTQQKCFSVTSKDVAWFASVRALSVAVNLKLYAVQFSKLPETACQRPFASCSVPSLQDVIDASTEGFAHVLCADDVRFIVLLRCESLSRRSTRELLLSAAALTMCTAA